MAQSYRGAVVGDVEKDDLDTAPVDLVFAGLVLEYLDTVAALPRMRSMVRLGGTFYHGTAIGEHRYAGDYAFSVHKFERAFLDHALGLT